MIAHRQRKSTEIFTLRRELPLSYLELASVSDSAGIRIVRGAAGDGHCAGLGNGYDSVGLGGEVGGGGGTGEDEDGYESADDVFHDVINSLRLVCKKFLWTHQM